MRIEAVDRLLTEDMREDILNRLDHLIRRLAKSRKKADLEKHMIATAVQTAFQQSDFPWGMTHFVAVIFQRSLGLEQKIAEEEQLMEQIKNLIGNDLSVDKLISLANDPDFSQKIEQNIDTDSKAFQQLAAKVKQESDKFMEQIWKGHLDLKLYSEDEVMRYFELIQERLELAGQDLANDDSPEIADIVTSSIDICLDKILTSDRLEQMGSDLLEISQEWHRNHKPYAHLLQMETNHLKSEQPSENVFVRGVYISQIKQMFPELEENEHRPMKKKKKSRGRRGRRGKKKRI